MDGNVCKWPTVCLSPHILRSSHGNKRDRQAGHTTMRVRAGRGRCTETTASDTRCRRLEGEEEEEEEEEARNDACLVIIVQLVVLVSPV